MTVTGGTGGAPLFSFTCKNSVFWPELTCTYAVTGVSYTITGGNPAMLAASKQKLVKVSGTKGACSETGTITATYTVTSPSPLFIGVNELPSGAKAALCAEAISPCPIGSRYLKGTAVKTQSSNLSIATGLTGWKCGSSTLTGSVQGESTPGAPVSVESLTTSLCTWNGGESCSEVVGTGTPWSSQWVPTSGGNGTVAISNIGLKMVCNSSLGLQTCRYAASEAVLSFSGGSAATLAANEVPLLRQVGSSGSCAETAKLSASYTISTPTPIFVEAT